MAKNKELPPRYYNLLWIIVITLFILVFILLGVLQVGQGRWECGEQKIYKTTKCITDLDPTTKDDCSIDYVVNCTKEVWTRHP